MQDKLNRWLLDNALAHHPDQQALLNDNEALQAASACQGNDAEKLAVFTEHLKISSQLITVIDDYRRYFDMARIVFWLVAFLVGASSAFALLTATANHVNLMSVTLFCALLPMFSLCLWLGVSLLRFGQSDSISGGMLGRLVNAATHLLSKLMIAANTAPSVHQNAVFRAGRQWVNPWQLSLLTHSSWLFFSLGALLGTLFRLSFYQYDFYWGSTLLDSQQIAVFVQISFALPAALAGIPLNADLIASAQLDQSSIQTDRAVWAQLLLMSIVVYGIVPRLAFIALSQVKLRQSLKNLPDNYAYPLFRQALKRIKSLSEQSQQPMLAPRYPLPADRAAHTGANTIASIGIELDQSDRWPLIKEDTVKDLGHLINSQQYQSALTALESLEKPVDVLAFCSYARSPDNTTLKRLRNIQDIAEGRVLIVLCEQAIAESHQVDIHSRLIDWQTRAHEHALALVDFDCSHKVNVNDVLNAAEREQQT
ncbi:hypothetical protein MPL1_07653 [Methylophaga lonarensis MPL]|uniref:DUF2868 domain-containing protein n=1 Tax=Methylophaga lonarensis MPL TaxID=1286106 RepID=M7P0K1_9GAMM|nr:DUF2868 domain-containing protein [Methylophaga lonarensis]EMR13007.1 hypothetical protein MPL1_07653 [Methylophaga lonarensis MPL]